MKNYHIKDLLKKDVLIIEWQFNLPLQPYCSNMLLCPRCGFLAVNFNRSKVFCSFLWVGKNIFVK